jgi:hypothetical protein
MMNPSFGPQLLQDLHHASRRSKVQVLGRVLVNNPYQPHRVQRFSFRSSREHLDHFPFSQGAMVDILYDLGLAVFNHGAVAGIATARDLLRHASQAVNVRWQILKYGGAVAEDIVASEHGIFFLQNVRYVVLGVSRTMESSERGAFDLELLTVGDVFLASHWTVLMNCWLGSEFSNVLNTANVIRMPVCQ